jgi:hypothetical protein
MYINWQEKQMTADGTDRTDNRFVSPGILRLDPFWDPLRGDPAFQKLCEQKNP